MSNLHTETPITDKLIFDVMSKYPGTDARAEAKYFEAVHQELAPLARDFEKQIADLRYQVASLKSQLQDRWSARKS